MRGDQPDGLELEVRDADEPERELSDEEVAAVKREAAFALEVLGVVHPRNRRERRRLERARRRRR